MNLTKMVREIEAKEHFYLIVDCKDRIGRGSTIALALQDYLRVTKNSDLRLQVYICGGHALWADRKLYRNSILISYISNTVTDKRIVD